MDKIRPARFFLGANTPNGFYSLYGGFTDRKKDHLFILKGGPGCGKSTFMKKIGAACEEAGHFVEYIHCSGDPESLDGVYVPALNVAYVDGTAPHVIEPELFGAQASYINMGAFYDLSALSGHKESVAALTREYKAHYDRAFGLLAGAASLRAPAPSHAAVSSAEKRVLSIIRREKRGKGDKRSLDRFLSGYTCLGHMALFPTVEALAGRVFVLDNDSGLAYPALDAAAREAESRGHAVIRCRCPLRPELTEHLILPDTGLALVTATRELPYTGPRTRHIRLDAIARRDGPSDMSGDARRVAKLRAALVSEALGALRLAKAAHDDLEAQYIPAVDFAGLDRLAGRHMDALLG